MSIVRAMVGEVVVAESGSTESVEGNAYFPPDSVDWTRLVRVDETTVCPWKGVATYFDVVTDTRHLHAAAWTYEDPTPAAAHIRGYLAFWRGVTVR